MVPVALEAAEILRSRGQGAVVINASIINLPDVPTIASSLRRTGGRLITIEDHQIIGGMGAQLVHALTRDGVGLRYQGLGVRGEFGQSAYAARELYAKHGLTAAAVAQAAHGLAQESS
jgi:transketolase